MPRYGKQFKLFDGIIPCLELDITGLCEGNGELLYLATVANHMSLFSWCANFHRFHGHLVIHENTIKNLVCNTNR